MTLKEKMARIVKNLKEGTAGNSVRWESTIDDGFITSRPDSSIVIEKTQKQRAHTVYSELLAMSPLPNRIYRIVLADSRGVEVAAIDDEDLPNPEDLIGLYEEVAESKAEELADAWLR